MKPTLLKKDFNDWRLLINWTEVLFILKLTKNGSADILIPNHFPSTEYHDERAV